MNNKCSLQGPTAMSNYKVTYIAQINKDNKYKILVILTMSTALIQHQGIFISLTKLHWT